MNTRLRLRFQRGPRDAIESLHPAYFALVMATGIVAISLHLHGLRLLPKLMLWLNIFFYAALVLATVIRALRYPRSLLADIASHSRGVGFFTAVAASSTLGIQLLLQLHAMGPATFFWITAGMLWLVVTYGVFSVLTVIQDKPGLGQGLNGGWLVSVVATQSASILTVLMVSTGVAADWRQPLMFTALVLWLGAGALYMWLMTLIFYRYTFVRMSPADLSPPYWINMGAMAISTLAGAILLQEAALSPLVMELVPFIKGVTLFFWAVATWWIPMLLILGAWRYLIRGEPFTYDPLYWGVVFPLGMYSVCTYDLAVMLGTPFLMPISDVFMVLAALAWAVTALGMADSLLGALRRAG